MNHYPCTPEEWEQLNRETEELDRKMKEEEAERWARIERAERNADIMSYLSLAFSIIALLIILAKRL
jgi:hypothetical protein|nr:MAG TPA: hypothetical protein [Caudoviricetes sp.]